MKTGDAAHVHGLIVQLFFCIAVQLIMLSTLQGGLKPLNPTQEVPAQKLQPPKPKDP